MTNASSIGLALEYAGRSVAARQRTPEPHRSCRVRSTAVHRAELNAALRFAPTRSPTMAARKHEPCSPRSPRHVPLPDLHQWDQGVLPTPTSRRSRASPWRRPVRRSSSTACPRRNRIWSDPGSRRRSAATSPSYPANRLDRGHSPSGVRPDPIAGPTAPQAPGEGRSNVRVIEPSAFAVTPETRRPTVPSAPIVRASLHGAQRQGAALRVEDLADPLVPMSTSSDSRSRRDRRPGRPAAVTRVPVDVVINGSSFARHRVLLAACALRVQHLTLMRLWGVSSLGPLVSRRPRRRAIGSVDRAGLP